ncbi:exodeoxyribonuclease VII large subunit [Polynucleobacter paneuropaeus]|uniref:Exodeoxyribonuclease 7 large subunit n=1 Tax=Polynucleobacter paneuropaeus TaxID=2527775 RepID=A0AAE2YLJ3_9BURK|nr:exodeoxyribonuclease VII large subunit [Polynucleobacter paneuropaeus]MBT8522064.1 exodeoxyribonuclease VII large subunit [Polynucleobacter paneuropaeus]MBT8539423.1 exodeoxyribonuclease VII large subunit [Polynucleobacter paneuropaeus]MBT8588825.1 exodeoxyribonuclease VII large subunit [Polynucleobacter paneuropaeus]MBT8591803.1 exodeoxyribonuclease VII large subunit [Polynucleobacter paneuropaeus]MBT8597194.1 exodeoxyribonuclease VII large subunit [Polynucleobacter paneuropaeus]
MSEISREVLSVGDLNRAIASSLEAQFDTVLVSGEISNFKAYDSGHWYFSLKDDEGQIRCVMFRGRNSQVGFMPQSGDLVEVSASLGMYVPRGDVQLTIQGLRKAGMGGLYEAFLKLKAKLTKEGLFDLERKREIPSHPRAIGIITSPQAAALKDVLSTLQRRSPHIPIVIYPTLVQGPDAPAGIISAIQSTNQEAAVDVILLVRGGGSIEDLWAFNDEQLAYAIAGSAIPIVSGVGHETDVTIADFVADLRAPTPTGAAELSAPRKDQLLQELAAIEQALYQRLMQRVEREAQTLDQLALRLSHALPNPDRMREQITSWQTRLQQAWSVQIDNFKRNQNHYQLQLEMLNPQRTLERGYAVILNPAMQAIRKPQDLNTQNQFEVRLADGSSQVRFKDLNPL